MDEKHSEVLHQTLQKVKTQLSYIRRMEDPQEKILGLVGYKDKLEDFTYQIVVGNFMCSVEHYEQCVPPVRYYPWYIWTKEGLKIQIKLISFKIIISIISIF